MAGIVKVVKKDDAFSMYHNMKIGDMYYFIWIDPEVIEVINGTCDCIACRHDDRYYVYETKDAVIGFKVIEEE